MNSLSEFLEPSIWAWFLIYQIGILVRGTETYREIKPLIMKGSEEWVMESQPQSEGCRWQPRGIKSQKRECSKIQLWLPFLDFSAASDTKDLVWNKGSLLPRVGTWKSALTPRTLSSAHVNHCQSSSYSQIILFPFSKHYQLLCGEHRCILKVINFSEERY